MNDAAGAAPPFFPAQDRDFIHAFSGV